MRSSVTEIETKIKEIASKITTQSKRPDEITLNTSLFDDLGLDSLGMIELIIEIEETFNLMLSDEELLSQGEWIATIDTIVSFVSQKIDS